MTKLSGWLRHWCLANALKKRSNKGMKLPLLIELSQQQMQRNLTTSFFEGGPPPITVHGEGAKNVADGTTRQLKPGAGTPFEPVVPWPGERQIPKPSTTNNIKTKSAGLTKRVQNQVRKKTKQI
jgi:hypothetical protein